MPEICVMYIYLIILFPQHLMEPHIWENNYMLTCDTHSVTLSSKVTGNWLTVINLDNFGAFLV